MATECVAQPYLFGGDRNSWPAITVPEVQPRGGPRWIDSGASVFRFYFIVSELQ